MMAVTSGPARWMPTKTRPWGRKTPVKPSQAYTATLRSVRHGCGCSSCLPINHRIGAARPTLAAAKTIGGTCSRAILEITAQMELNGVIWDGMVVIDKRTPVHAERAHLHTYARSCVVLVRSSILWDLKKPDIDRCERCVLGWAGANDLHAGCAPCMPVNVNWQMLKATCGSHHGGASRNCIQ